jgi:hypothetical protein
MAINNPRLQITSMGKRLFPHCILNPATLAGAKNKNQLIPKFDGFQI